MAFFLITAIIIGVLSIGFLGNDNPIEQATEKVIEDVTGIKTDLSPEEQNQAKE